MKSHHFLTLLVLSLLSYTAKNIITYYDHTAAPAVVASGNSEKALVKKTITALPVIANTDRSATLESPGTETSTSNSIPDLKTADPGREITLLEPPTANQSGSAVMTFPIKIPAGRNEMEPELAIQYNSEGGNGWLGLDWNLTTASIEIETRWGVPRYNSLLETETYVMNGEQLSPVAHRSDPVARTPNEKQFYPRVESDFDKITRHGNDPKNYWWEVTNKNGRRQFYGGNAVNGVDQTAVLTDANGNIAYWAITEDRDANDNFIKYSYSRVIDPGTPGGNPGSDLYPALISYTGHGTTQGRYSVEFTRDRQLNEPKRPDISISAKWGFKQVTTDLLRKISVKYNDQNIRTFELNYQQGAFYKTLLHSISEFDAGGALFTTHSFEYYNDVLDTTGKYVPLLGAENWIPQSDNVKGSFINPIDHFGDQASMLGGNKSLGGGFGMAVTIGPDDEDYAMKTNTAGINFGFNYTKSEGLLALVDINGDGLADKVFKENGQLYFRANRSGPSGTHDFGPKQSIIGINDFNKGETFLGSVGLESHFGIFAGFEYAHTEDITSVYFADVNGDQLMDIVDNGKVYFNHIDANGNPSFTLSSGDTPSAIRSNAGIDPGLVTVDSLALEKAIDDNPLHDVVRTWVAPFAGTVSITNPVSLIQDLSADTQSHAAADGVRVAIQHKGTELWSAVITENDFTPKTPVGVNAIPVQKGDRIYFRVQSRVNGAYDQVQWSPEITYTNQSPLNDANGLPVYKFNAKKDFLLSGPFSTGLSINGTIHIQGNFIKPVTSDDVEIKIVKRSNGLSTTLLQQTFLWNQTANLAVSINQNVLRGDALFFSVSSNTNIDWTSLQWNPFVYYTASSDPAITQLFDNNNNPLLYIYPTVDFKSFNNIIKQGFPWTAPASDTFVIQPNPVLLPSFESGNIVFTIKKENQLIKKQVIPVTLGFLGAHPPITIIVNNNDKFFFEYHVDSPQLAPLFISTNVTADADPGNPETITGGLYTVDRSFIFGPLYRHWGQFAYNGNRARANQPIIESDLVLNAALTNTSPPSINLKNTAYSGSNLSAADSINQMQGTYTNANGYDAKKDKFIFLAPNNEKRSWIGYDDLTYVKKDTISSSRMGKDDLLPVNPITNSFAQQASGAVGIKKVSGTDNFSLAAGYGPLGGSTSFGFTNFRYDFLDMNGDRYPDVVSANKIQYTKSAGGLEDAAITPSFGNEDVDRSDHFSIGISLGGSFPKSNAPNSRSTPKGAKAARAQSQSETTIGLSADLGYNSDSTAFALMDINGDDLPDRVYKNGKVKLNIGYAFLPEESWDYHGIRQGSAISYGAGLGINIGDYSIAAGFGVSRSENTSDISLQDMNGDGLLDYVFYSSSDIYVAINKGNGFATAIKWVGANAIHKAVSTGESLNIAFTIGIPIIPIAPVVKLCFNPSFNIAQGADRTSVQFDDIDGDGFPDFLQSEKDNELSVSRSNIKRTNKLKKVNRPLGASFTLDYERVGNTYQMPNSVWVLSGVKIYDGVPGDGADYMHNTFEYENGRYDRNEREFYGFGTVKTFHRDTEHGDIVYREFDREYITGNFYEKGLLKSDILKDAAGKKFTETVNSYELKDIHNGTDLPDNIKQSDTGAAFPALVSTQQFFYEGQVNPGKSTGFSFAYDALGNIIKRTDFGDPGSDDDVSTNTSYFSIPAKYIMNVPSSLTITGSGQTYRQYAYSVDNNTGNVTEERRFLQSGEVAKYNMTYDIYGNLASLTRPENASGQRLSYNHEYDGDVHTYNIKTTDSYGYTSAATYDVRFGQPLSATDINGQKTLFTIDNAGRITKITDPMEIAAGQPFTVAFEYHPEAVVPWALAKNFDPAHPANFIETATFCDGLGREVQTKKDGALFVAPQVQDQEVMLVAGENKYDAFGRTDTIYHPTTEPKGNTGVMNGVTDSITPTRISFDILDRVLTYTLPDQSTTKMEYGFGTDRNGVMQFKTTLVDGNGIRTEKFINVRDLLKATKAQYSQGSDVWTSYDYNPVDELIKVTDDQGNTIVSTFDRMGRRTSVSQPDAGLTKYQYDLNDNVIQAITANLQNGPGIKYTYEQERLVKVTYPQNPQNNVTLTYGASGAAFFGAGQVIKQQDATGTQEFFYNPHGLVAKNKRVINVPGNDPLTYITEWTYDTWDRLTAMVYPDGESLTYNYNAGGLVQNMSGIKSGTSYNYLLQSGYDKFEQQVYRRYGNRTEMTYAYEPGRRRLQNMTARTAANRLMMDNNYTYDKEINILNIVNNAPVPTANLMGGKSNYQFTYDDLYRLTRATGKFSGSTHEHRYTVAMTYNSIFNIVKKSQVHERKAYDETTWTLRNQTSYSYDYNYNPAGKPHAAVHIGEKAFTYDANGNQTGWHHDVSAQNRQITWDEDDRMKSLSDNGELFSYTYDGSGERVLKNGGDAQTVRINGKTVAQSVGLGNYTVYVNPYMVVRSGGFTKHFYVNGERIVSKLGESGNGNSNGTAGNNSGNNSTSGGNNGNGNNQEAFQFYYHPDHLGNTAFVTNRLGEVYQHLEYFPFGEIFIDEHGNQERTPYLYNGKELDEETGLYYYGARYYDAITSIWESTDPLWELPDEVDKSPYAYVTQNPIVYNDPDGRVKGSKNPAKAQAKKKKISRPSWIAGTKERLYKKQQIKKNKKMMIRSAVSAQLFGRDYMVKIGKKNPRLISGWSIDHIVPFRYILEEAAKVGLSKTGLRLASNHFGNLRLITYGENVGHGFEPKGAVAEAKARATAKKIVSLYIGF